MHLLQFSCNEAILNTTPVFTLKIPAVTFKIYMHMRTHLRVRKLPSTFYKWNINANLIQQARQNVLLTGTGPQPVDRKCFAHQAVKAAHCQHRPSQWHCNQHTEL